MMTKNLWVMLGVWSTYTLGVWVLNSDFLAITFQTNYWEMAGCVGIPREESSSTSGKQLSGKVNVV